MTFGWSVISCGASTESQTLCGMTFAVPDAHAVALKNYGPPAGNGKREGPGFFCPQGHRISYFTNELSAEGKRIRDLESELSNVRGQVAIAERGREKAELERCRAVGFHQSGSKFIGYCGTCQACQPKGSAKQKGALHWRKVHTQKNHGG